MLPVDLVKFSVVRFETCTEMDYVWAREGVKFVITNYFAKTLFSFGILKLNCV